ncbi:MAG: aldose epimerase family protein [Verrucomicrobiales bacterium]
MQIQSANHPSRSLFGYLPYGAPAHLYTLENRAKTRVKVSDFGATLVSVETVDQRGNLADIVLGFDSVEDYAADSNPYFGASVGRFGNRIAHGRFRLDDQDYQLVTNNDPGGIPCHLHGGTLGFNRRPWKVVDQEAQSITFEYLSPDGEEGYPGNLTARITYRLTEDNELHWEASATTDKATPINLVNHTYWNLSGLGSTSTHDHILTLPSTEYLPATAGLIPTGERRSVMGTPMDFTTPTVIGSRVDEDFEALHFARGYDACWILSETITSELKLAGRVEHPTSGRTLEVYTNQPGVHFYAGNFLNETIRGKGGVPHPENSGLCLETENFPDAPNHPHFPNCILRPGETYRHRMNLRFGIRRE